MGVPEWMSSERTVSLPSTRVYEDEQPEVFAAAKKAAADFSRAKVFCYNRRYDEEYLGAEKSNMTQALKDWSTAELGYRLPEYYITSVINKVSGILRAQKELFRTQEEDRAITRKTREEKIESLRTTEKNLSRMKNELIDAQKKGRSPVIPPIYTKRYADVRTGDGREPASEGERNYLFECSIDRSLKNTRANIGRVRHKIHRAEQNHQDIPSRITFGSKALYKLKDTGNMPADKWRQAWHDARMGGLYLAGRHTSKNCNFLARPDFQSNTMTIRVPDKSGVLTDVVIRDLSFPYRGDELEEALSAPPSERGSVSYTLLFRRDADGRRYFFVRADFTISRRLNQCLDDGIVSVDCNIDCLALTDLSADGRVLDRKVIGFDLEGLSSGEADDVIGRACSEAVAWARAKKKPVGMEDLDLRATRASMPYRGKALNRCTSRFAYAKMTFHMEGVCFRNEVGLMKADPAYTSLIGKTKFMLRMQGPVHVSAAAAIGRRCLGCAERVPSYLRPLLPKKTKTAPSYRQWRFLYRRLSGVPLSAFRKRMAPLDGRALKALKQQQ